MQLADRLSKCLLECLLVAEKDKKSGYFTAIYNAGLLNKSLEARLWDNSPYVSKQFRKIGALLSSNLSKAGVKSIKVLCCTDPREIEKLLKKTPPFGNELVEEAKRFPSYEVFLQTKGATVDLIVQQKNPKADKNLKGKVILLVGDNHNNLLFYKDEL